MRGPFELARALLNGYSDLDSCRPAAESYLTG